MVYWKKCRFFGLPCMLCTSTTDSTTHCLSHSTMLQTCTMCPKMSPVNCFDSEGLFSKTK